MTKGCRRHSRLNRPRMLKNSRMVSCTYTNGGNSITPLPRIFTRPAFNLYNIWLSELPSRLASSAHPINIWRNHINWPSWVLAMHSRLFVDNPPAERSVRIGLDKSYLFPKVRREPNRGSIAAKIHRLPLISFRTKESTVQIIA